MQSTKTLVAAVGLGLIVSVSVSAQFDVGRVTGTIYDPSGAIVPQATVTIKNIGTGITTTAQSDSFGNFVASALPYGDYVVTATASGFGTATSKTVTVNVGSSVNVVLKLPLGGGHEQVTVTGTVSTVQTGSAAIENTVSTEEVQNLPLNGRDIMGLIALTPGSVTSGTFGQTSINGAETSFTGLNTLLDGADATRIDTNATLATFGNQESRITRASVDSIAEVKIMNTGYSAEYGRALGPVVNLITKSGTDSYHGELFEFFRNEALNARNFFDYPNRGPFKLNDFGGNLGGPIVKDKLFFFGNYEGVRQHISNSVRSATFTAAQRSLFVPSMQPYVDALVPLPPGPPVCADTACTIQFVAVTQLNKLREDTGSVKLDYYESSTDRWMLRYNPDDSFTAFPFSINKDQIDSIPARNQYFRLDETHIFSPTLLNEAGFAINRQFTNAQAGGDDLPLFSNFANVGAEPGPSLFSELSPKTSFQFLESLTKTAGRHTMKFGADIRGNRINNELRQQDILTYFTLSGLQNNHPFADTRLGYPTLGFRDTNWDFYAQDDWKATPRLTLNYGVRYEYNSVWEETNVRVSNFDYATQQILPPGIPFYQPDRNDFGPRLGFAYDPFGSGKTVIRGFGAIFYLPQLQGAVNSLPSNNFPNVEVTVFQDPTLAFPVPAVLPAMASVHDVNALDPHLRDTYSEQWGLNVQRELLPQIVFTLGYTGNHGVKLPAGAAYAGLELNNINPLTGARPSAAFGEERLLGDFLSSNYNALQITARRHAGRVTFDANYTWSHEIDNAPSIFSAFEDSNNINADRGHGDIDVRHNFTADVLYDLPSLHNQVSAFRGALGGWRAGTILQARSGLPVNIALQPAFFATSILRPDYVPGQSIQAPKYSVPDSQLNAAAFKAPAGALGTIARNAGRGPHFVQWDLSLQKDFHLNERWSMQFRSDMFNILNHPNFSNPDATLCSSYTASSNTCVPNLDFGRSGSTIGNLVGIGTSRQVQFALKLLF
ncbi:MAG: hypothetical protein DMG27_02115 [Acidobacteria bacterium]|nr:MAG: hypothetical protein DMG27_02115 [Acidobacteriota bacterium]